MNPECFNRTRPSGFRTAITLAAGLAFTPVSADGPPMSGGEFDVAEYTVEGAGGAVSGGAFSAHSSLAQVDAHTVSEGGAFALEGGFWPGARGHGDVLFRDGFE